MVQERGRVEQAGEVAGERGDADVEGDVAVELFLRQTEIGELRGHSVAGVIGEQEELGPTLRVDELEVGRKARRGAGHAAGF